MQNMIGPELATHAHQQYLAVLGRKFRKKAARDEGAEAADAMPARCKYAFLPLSQAFLASMGVRTGPCPALALPYSSTSRAHKC